ncbi:Centromere 3 [Lecanosticta acicola]|uniref:Centromere 3 n=1 Tax=Lecanosticta acicola TaxID=111012 RepID=A0AAI9EDU2_9PEZI|nr:Centromere 3 [Lecanosticta acicola]
MAPAGKNTTPGRRKRTDNQYFDVGKVGRKTGITLKDTGVRDEHGLEPLSGIYSSPGSAQQNGSKTLESDEMDVQNSSAPDVATTLSQRRTPRFPPPRQSTPRHTNIGSPRRMSSVKQNTRAKGAVDEDDEDAHAQPRANRRLDFGGPSNRDNKRASVVDAQSPFKPKKVLRRSTGPARRDPFDLHDEDDDSDGAKTSIEHTNGVLDDDENVEESIERDDPPVFMDDGDSYPMETEHTAVSLDEPNQQQAGESPLKRKRGRPRKSDRSVDNSQLSASTGSGKKRTRSSIENDQSLNDSTASAGHASMGPPPKRHRSSNADKVIIHHDEGTEAIDPSMIAFGDEYQADGDMVPEDEAGAQTQLDAQLEEQQEPQPAKKGKGRPKGKGKAAATRETSSKAAAQKKGSPVKLDGSPSKKARSGSAGPISNVNLRATTPFEDASHQVSRAGRNLIQPLKFWENESRIWRAGEIEGIVRAEQVEKPKPVKRKKKGRKGKGGRLQDIAEESEAESVMPDEWEEEMGVITGTVASWDPATKNGDANNPVQEDLAFAASSIITRDVAGSEFKYAKIMTIPFFGAGVVELPPEGFKRAKNSRKMQMVFFVHEGKVLVEVGAMGLEVNSFALSKGGVWIVPRGNNYAITNESSTTTAKIFFAQGCVVEGAE